MGFYLIGAVGILRLKIIEFLKKLCYTTSIPQKIFSVNNHVIWQVCQFYSMII